MHGTSHIRRSNEWWRLSQWGKWEKKRKNVQKNRPDAAPLSRNPVWVLDMTLKLKYSLRILCVCDSDEWRSGRMCRYTGSTGTPYTYDYEWAEIRSSPVRAYESGIQNCHAHPHVCASCSKHLIYVWMYVSNLNVSNFTTYKFNLVINFSIVFFFRISIFLLFPSIASMSVLVLNTLGRLSQLTTHRNRVYVGGERKQKCRFFRYRWRSEFIPALTPCWRGQIEQTAQSYNHLKYEI